MLLPNGDAVMDDDAVVAADTVIGVDLGTKTGALMLSADMDENTPDPVRGRRTLPLLTSSNISTLYASSFHLLCFPMIHLTFLQFLGVVMVCSIATISVHFFGYFCCYTQQLSRITHHFMIELAPFSFKFAKAMYDNVSTESFCVGIA